MQIRAVPREKQPNSSVMWCECHRDIWRTPGIRQCWQVWSGRNEPKYRCDSAVKHPRQRLSSCIQETNDEWKKNVNRIRICFSSRLYRTTDPQWLLPSVTAAWPVTPSSVSGLAQMPFQRVTNSGVFFYLFSLRRTWPWDVACRKHKHESN